MNYINNGEYYLVAKYKGEEPDIIKINQNWYLRDKKEDNYLSMWKRAHAELDKIRPKQ